MIDLDEDEPIRSEKPISVASHNNANKANFTFLHGQPTQSQHNSQLINNFSIDLYNQSLSAQNQDAIRNFLISQGHGASQLANSMSLIASLAGQGSPNFFKSFAVKPIQ